MIDQEILFRAGLMLAVLSLAAVFGSFLGERMEEDPKDDMQVIIHELLSVASALHQQEPGSSMKVSFGDPSGSGICSLVLPSKIGGDHFELQFKPGLLMIKCAGHVVSVEFGPWFVPSLPPMGASLCPPSIYRNISLLAGGYVVSTPVVMVFTSPESSKEGEVHVYPDEMEEVLPPPGVLDLHELIEDSGELTPEWMREARMARGDIHAYGHPVLLIKMEARAVIGGSCPLPIVLTEDLRIGTDVLSSPSDHIRFYRQVVMGMDGVMTFMAGSEIS